MQKARSLLCYEESMHASKEIQGANTHHHVYHHNMYHRLCCVVFFTMKKTSQSKIIKFYHLPSNFFIVSSYSLKSFEGIQAALEDMMIYFAMHSHTETMCTDLTLDD
jgi:hypothetical protein